MDKFLIKTLSNTDITEEIIKIGYDKSYAFRGADKFRYLNLKIFGITSVQGNILKQVALSVGADCATHKEVITGKIEKSDCILGGNFAQLKTIAQKLQLQPFGLKDLGELIENFVGRIYQSDNNNVGIVNPTYSNICPDANSDFIKKNKTKIVGVLNLTKNSFSDGGKYFEYDDAIAHLHELINDGADIIDIGAESTKPYSNPVPADKQLEKIIPVLKYINENNIHTPISIDTRSSAVAQECIKNGVAIINDVSGLDYDEKMVKVLAQNPQVKVIIQHSKGTPETMQENPVYENLIDEIFIDLKARTDFAISQGVKKENIITDAGIGFGKSRSDNYEILKRWQEFRSLGFPVMLGVSRKSLLNMPDASNNEKDIFSLALGSILINDGVDYLRVHNVKLHRTFMDIIK